METLHPVTRHLLPCHPVTLHLLLSFCHFPAVAVVSTSFMSLPLSPLLISEFLFQRSNRKEWLHSEASCYQLPGIVATPYVLLNFQKRADLVTLTELSWCTSSGNWAGWKQPVAGKCHSLPLTQLLSFFHTSSFSPSCCHPRATWWQPVVVVCYSRRHPSFPLSPLRLRPLPTALSLCTPDPSARLLPTAGRRALCTHCKVLLRDAQNTGSLP